MKSISPFVLQARQVHRKELRQHQEFIHHTNMESLGRIKNNMKHGSDEHEKIIKVDVWLNAYKPKQKFSLEYIAYTDSRLAQMEMDMERLKVHFETVLPRQDQGDNTSENNNVVIPTNQRINSTSDVAISKKTNEGENISTSSRHVTRSMGEKKRKEGEKNGDMSIRKKRKVENISISPKHVTISKGEKRKKSGKNGVMSMSKKRKNLKFFRFLPYMLHARKGIRSEKKARSSAPQRQQLHLLSFYGDDEEKIVATADLVSKDPTDKVHSVLLGRGCWKVLVREVFEDIELFRPTLELSTLSSAKGSLLAWPVTHIKLL